MPLRPGDSGAFRKDILPILQDKCFRCHGEKNKGGLKLNSREAALRGGDSEIPAIVPGKPDASELLVRLRTDDEDARHAAFGRAAEQSANRQAGGVDS